MPASTAQNWDARFFRTSPLFDTLQVTAEKFSKLSRWPDLNDYASVFKSVGINITPVPQASRPQCFEELYESRIYLQGELQTRLKNWHDFFNALVWLRFPKTKTVLNELHYLSSLKRAEKTNRSPLENAITLFDECGALVISQRHDLLQMIRDHQWKTLFVDHRDAFEQEIKCIVFGHAMYEKALNPYIGMTTNTLLIQSTDLLQQGPGPIDEVLADYWKQGGITSTKDLKPFPVLGVPGWYADNARPEFYENRHYFRPGQR